MASKFIHTAEIIAPQRQKDRCTNERSWQGRSHNEGYSLPATKGTLHERAAMEELFAQRQSKLLCRKKRTVRTNSAKEVIRSAMTVASRQQMMRCTNGHGRQNRSHSDDYGLPAANDALHERIRSARSFAQRRFCPISNKRRAVRTKEATRVVRTTKAIASRRQKTRCANGRR